jgi:protein-S-isoprenylcysteine O-methyltransferase Ste14
VSDRARGRLLVVDQFFLITVIALAPGQRLWPNSAWLLLLEMILLLVGATLLTLAFVHLGPALTANPVPKADAPLQTAGIYSWIRHPIYTGVLALGIGVALYRASTISLFAAASLILLLNFKSRWEEAFLKSKHSEYLAYLQRVPRFIPKIGRNKDVD